MNKTLEIKLLSDSATMPVRSHATDAGFDIFAAETKIIRPQYKDKVATDVAVNIPKGYVGLLTSRSGVSSKTHLVIETGKIDAGFQGNMQINIKNDDTIKNNLRYDTALNISGETVKRVDGEKDYENCYQILKGDKLAQLVIVPIWTPDLKQVEEFESETARGNNGFGSTGI
ncbi:dUTP diphosphatase [Staphylococcus equorum]|uniref:dUTP diphosphatase n=1 Tax=Staphylococcus equorum TaxID=246432 RepID=UPI003CE8E07F